MNTFLLVALLTQAQPSIGIECNQEEADLGIQPQLNACAHEEYLQADKALNTAWKKAAEMARGSDTEEVERGREGEQFDKLLTAQRAWLAFRDAHCEAESNVFRGGTIRSLIHSGCLRQLTEMRTKQLIDYTRPLN